MTQPTGTVLKCNVCGKNVEILNPGAPETVCCGQPMVPMEAQTNDYKLEKHVPKITVDGNNVTVDVGISMGSSHPMVDTHYIMWIKLICKENCYKRKFLKPGDEPKATFIVSDTEGLIAEELCNLHSLWRS